MGHGDIAAVRRTLVAREMRQIRASREPVVELRVNLCERGFFYDWGVRYVKGTVMSATS
jgi:hypothetical protein